MGGFPSGQREQTVNLLSTTSVVRIHLLPPSNSPAVWLGFCLAGGTVDEPCAQIYADSVMRHLPYCLIFADNSTMRAGSAACTARRLRPSLPLVMRRNARQNAPLYNALHLWRTSTTDLTPRRGSAACTARRLRHDTPQSVLASLWYFAGTPIRTGEHPPPPTYRIEACLNIVRFKFPFPNQENRTE